MSEVRFQVQGSAPDPYEVRFVRQGNSGLFAFCTCPAGEKGQHCKHRLAILSGETKGIVSGNEGEAGLVLSWLTGSDLEEALNDLDAAEITLAEAKSRVSSAKRRVGRVMQG